MKHLGDITKINGYDVPIVDIVTGGSPCQDLSVAGKRAGLDGERSGLFMEQIRIIKEMREYDKRTNTRSDVDVRPRYMVWENVPGAFSSNKGDDFRCVLEETAKISEKDASIPRPEGGRWNKAGCIVGDGWSIAWRLHDAQFWGVPQRRKRICLLADFNGDSAPRILFELFRKTDEGNEDETVMGIGEESQPEIQPLSESLSGNTEQSEQERQESSRNVGECVDSSSFTLKIRGGTEFDSSGKRAGKGALVQTELSGTIGVSQDQSLICIEGNGSRDSHKGDGYKESDVMYSLNTVEQHAVAYGEEKSPVILENHTADSRVKVNDDGIVQTLSSRMGTGGGNVPMVMEQNCVYSIGNGQVHDALSPSEEVSKTLNCMDDTAKILTLFEAYQHHGYREGLNCNPLTSKQNESVRGDTPLIYENQSEHINSVVRRLTPLECERLQGFPDNWTDIGEWIDTKGKKRKDSDSPRYKALGNSIALPFWRWLAERITANYERRTTMASLFDGIGGFPLVFSQFGCKPLWASEIEDFPIAVTKIRFGEDET